MAEFPVAVPFHPKSRCLIDQYLVPRALHGRVPDDDAVTDGVDVYATRPEALPFQRRNIASRRIYRNQLLWGYFFAKLPEAAATEGGSSRNFRKVAPGGLWCWCSHEKGYADDDGEVYAFRTRFAFYEDDGKLRPWRMKEYRLNESAARFRGVAIPPGAANLVVCKVYLYFKMEIAKKEPPPMKYSRSDNGDGNEVRAPKRIKMTTDQTDRPSTEQPPRSNPTHVPAPPGKPRRRVVDSPPDVLFHLDSRRLIDRYLIPRALHGRVPDDDAVNDRFDVYATRPEKLPFQMRNISRRIYRNQLLWGYFFAKLPEAAATERGSSRNFRKVASGGLWCWCSHEKGYADDDGEVYAFRTRFAFYEDDGKLRLWRMKEYRLNESAARFRGVAFPPGAANLVVCKVYLYIEMVIPPPMKYSRSDNGDGNEVRAPKRIKMTTDQTVRPSREQPPQSSPTHVPAPPGKPRGRVADSPPDVLFHLDSRRLIDRYLIPRALHGRVPDYISQTRVVAEGVDVYATRPEALPFLSRNHDDRAVFGYFFATRPEATAAAAGGSSRNFRKVAPGGRWCWCCHEKGYADDDGQVYAFRTRFAFYEDDGKLTPWRMKEYRLNEGAARFRGVAFHPSATNLVVWKVYNYKKKEIDEAETSTESDSGDEFSVVL